MTDVILEVGRYFPLYVTEIVSAPLPNDGVAPKYFLPRYGRFV